MAQTRMVNAQMQPEIVGLGRYAGKRLWAWDLLPKHVIYRYVGISATWLSQMEPKVTPLSQLNINSASNGLSTTNQGPR
jgi:hypothetical protein